MKNIIILTILVLGALCNLKSVTILPLRKLPPTESPSPSTSEDHQPVISFSISTEKLYPKQLKTSSNYAREAQLEDTLEVPSTESSPSSWSKEVTSLGEMELEENQSSETNSMTKTLSWSTNPTAFRWQMLAPTPMEVNSLLLLPTPDGWMEDMWFSVEFLTVRTWWRQWRQWDPNQAGRQRKWSSLSVQFKPSDVLMIL